ncbi:MAG: Fic family protein [Chthoniobacterales bacterium]|nr:Fic family protein [Chthoniobacterales bacterium]
MYLWERKNWPQWEGRLAIFSKDLLRLHHKQSKLLGAMESIGFPLREEARAQILVEEVLKTSAIEGEIFDPIAVRSSVAWHLGVNHGALMAADHSIDGVVEMVLDATTHHDRPLTKQRLFQWHHLLFPSGKNKKLRIGCWRDDNIGPMQVVSGAIGRDRVHYEAPPATRVEKEMKQFLIYLKQEWKESSIDLFLLAARAHLWFVTIHPFDDGNGRIARAISDMILARADQTSYRCYSLSSQIQREQKNYYQQLEFAQHGEMDDADWIAWFLGCLERAIESAQEQLSLVLEKSHCWSQWSHFSLNQRQVTMINRLFHDFRGKLTTSKWAAITKCSPDTALRDIQELIAHGILLKEAAGGRSTSYRLKNHIPFSNEF